MDTECDDSPPVWVPWSCEFPRPERGASGTDLFGRYQRSEQALVLAMMEMVIQGVSTRKVSAITEEFVREQFFQVHGQPVVHGAAGAGGRLE